MLMNGDLIKNATGTEPGSFLHKVATSNLKPAQKIEYIFHSTLARNPTQREVDAANTIVAWRKGDAAAALQDLFWAVLNSNEFILQH
jgi:hypothetical protein